MQTVNFSGYIDNGDGEGAPNINVIMVNRTNIDLQYNFVSDANGRYAVAVEPGYYDIYLNGDGYGGVIYSGVIIEGDKVYDMEMIANIPGQPVIFGLVFFEAGGGFASGYTVELLTDGGSTVLAKTVTDNYGNFNFATCPVGYHQLRLSDNGNNPYLVPMPVPGVNVSITIHLLKEQTMEKPLPDAQPETKSYGKAFASVCKFNQGVWYIFTDGLLTGGEKTYMDTPGPVRLNVYTDVSANPLYKYAVCIDMRRNPFYAMPPTGNYEFKDVSGDVYSLTVFWPYLHTVSYNSTAPDIIKVSLSSPFGRVIYWPDAPECPNTV